VLLGVTLLSQIDTGTSKLFIAGCLGIVGIGMGISFQTYLVATQNAVPIQLLGVATAGLGFFRTLGGTLAVAGLGALLNNRLATELTKQLGDAAHSIDKQRLLKGGLDVTPNLVHGTRVALATALADSLLALVPLAIIGVVLGFLLPERPLRKTVGHPAPPDES